MIVWSLAEGYVVLRFLSLRCDIVLLFLWFLGRPALVESHLHHHRCHAGRPLL